MPNDQKILRLIKLAAEGGPIDLDLSDREISTLPPEISTLTNLTSLDLSLNNLTSLPSEISNLTNLTSLDLSRNNLTSLPPEITTLTSLTSLGLRDNKLTRLPGDITNLTNLTSLDLSRNQLTNFPGEITRLIGLTHLWLTGIRLASLPPEISNLTKLRLLDLSNNQLTSVLPEMMSLTNLIQLVLHNNLLDSLPSAISSLESLARLDLFRNGLSSIPAAIGNLTRLEYLDLGHNRLTSIPQVVFALTGLKEFEFAENDLEEIPREITKLINLTDLNLSRNKLTTLPPELSLLTKLSSLRLGENRLSKLPPEITKLDNLSSLDLRNNQLSIPSETLAFPSNVKAIFAAIAGLVSGERLNEAKMLVVGDGDVGKSSVVEQLIYGTFNPQKQTTLGVEINDEMKVLHSVVTGEGEPVKLNIWDFGGQEIQHSTHQFFLTTRSLYLLVVDARKGDQLTNIEYWLKLIASFGGDSPIIIVINQIDQLKGQRALNLDRKALQEKYNVRDFVETSCGTGEGISALKMAIAREVEQLKHVRDIWPREWIAIKQRLKDMQADYIPVEKYLEICGEENLNDEDLRQSLLDILHVLGTVVRFPGDTQVLNPRWVTQGVYGLLTSARLVKEQGQFDLNDVGKILAGLPDAKDHYPSHTHERLIKVMRHFQLCFEFTDRPGHYLIPRHLHENELDIPWDEADALKFQYHYDTLPDAVVSRFIVRMSQYIHSQYYWKNGVFLQSKGDKNRAKVKADMVDRKIFISIIGKEQTRRAFLAVIRSAFDEINSNFKIEIRQMIPVPESPRVLVSYEDLLVHEEMNEEEILVPELRKKFSVRALLDGVEDLDSRMTRIGSKGIGSNIVRRSLQQQRLEEMGPKLPQSAPQPRNNPLGSLMSFIFGFVVLLGAIVAAAVTISKWVSVTAGVMTGVIIVGALLAIGVLGAMQLRNDDRLSEDSFLKLMVESYKRLPLLRGKDQDE